MSVRDVVGVPLRAALGNLQLPAGEPVGDPGLFGPGSVTWRVHADTASMLVGGVSALLLQTLHPGAMAGVADHSDFRNDLYGRLHRTSLFVGTTTFGARPTAERAIAGVRRVHEHVVGTRPDGVAYSAGDPHLLTWVHVAEVSQFLAGHLRYAPHAVSMAEADRYYAEVAVIARELGATDVPTSAAEVAAYFDRARPELAFGGQAREAIAILRNPPLPGRADRVGARLLFQIAAYLLPTWVRELLELDDLMPGVAARSAGHALVRTMRYGLGTSPIVAAARRRTADPTPTGEVASGGEAAPDLAGDVGGDVVGRP